MKVLAVALAAIMASLMARCDKEKASRASVPTGNSWSDAVTTDQTYVDFIKTWHMQITPDISLRVTAGYQPWLTTDCDTFCTFIFTMQQGDDPKKWVGFDCDAVTEKIIQTALVPLAEKDCAMLRDEAKTYWKDNSDPSEYTDAKGRVWKRK